MNEDIDKLILGFLREDLGQQGDHTTRATLGQSTEGVALMKSKDNGIAAGMEVAERVFLLLDASLKVEKLVSDCDPIEHGTLMMRVSGSAASILSAERTVLNLVQRMSGIATKTKVMSDLIADTGTRLLDTRKTTPGLRVFEKMAVRIGGGVNHRFGLYDMVMIKDNHSDYCGSAAEALRRVKNYLSETGLALKVVVEARDIPEIQAILDEGGADRILLDNFTPEGMKKAADLIAGVVETEASGGITEANLREYALTGVNFISSGALTHSVRSLDISLKAQI
jgi:nicotinate-nucleotide pyrophosphorylase (carboxylating)